MNYIRTEQSSLASYRPYSVMTSKSNISSSIENSLSSDDPIDTLKDFLVRICKDSCEFILEEAQ
jgi:hypothetical protein